MSGAIPLFPCMASWHAEGQVHLYFDNGLRASEVEYSEIFKLVKYYVLPTAGNTFTVSTKLSLI